LEEELLSSEENLNSTRYDKLFIASSGPIKLNEKELSYLIHDLKAAAEHEDKETIKARLKDTLNKLSPQDSLSP
jgi:FlaA1/EpsC-like NDP-sugar epimerase